MKSWYLLPQISAPMPFQMALDEILFRRFEQAWIRKERPAPMLRFFTSPEIWVSSGYAYAGWRGGEDSSGASSLPEEYRRYPRCRRLTGGGHVLHDGDLMFSLIAAKEEDERFRSVAASYTAIHEAIRCGLQTKGKRLRFYRCDEKLPRGNDCFRFPIASDLELDGRKIAGGGQKRSCGVLLHEESIRKLRGFERPDLIKCLTAALAEVFHVQWTPGLLLPEDLELSQRTGREKYELALMTV